MLPRRRQLSALGRAGSELNSRIEEWILPIGVWANAEPCELHDDFSAYG